jgi:RNA polymerase primary sigma factor
MRQLKITKSITNRESQSLEKYLQEIGKVELISPEEEVRLARSIKLVDPSKYSPGPGRTIPDRSPPIE